MRIGWCGSAKAPAPPREAAHLLLIGDRIGEAGKRGGSVTKSEPNTRGIVLMA